MFIGDGLTQSKGNIALNTIRSYKVNCRLNRHKIVEFNNIKFNDYVII